MGRAFPAGLSAALAYAARGWPVLPLHSPDPAHPSGRDCRRAGCASPAKHPRTRHGVRDATTDPEAIRRWWRMWPQANVGIATGGGLVVLDMDPRHDGDRSLDTLEEEHGEIRAPAVRTGGGGLHLYLAGDLPARGAFRPGLDLQAAGRLVVAPPSLHVSGRRYEWICAEDLPTDPAPVPAWLATIVDPPRPARAAKSPPADEPLSPRYIVAAIEDECLAVATAPEGTRNDRLNQAAYALARFVVAGAAHPEHVVDALRIAALHAGLGEREILRTIWSAFNAREAA